MLDDDGAAAMRAIVDDAAALIRTDAVETLNELQFALGIAFSTGADDAWRAVYRKFGRIVSRAEEETSSSARKRNRFAHRVKNRMSDSRRRPVPRA